MFKSKIEIREFAVKQAVAILGAGTSQKDVVVKAKEIESYIIGEAELPETSNEEEILTKLAGNISGLFQGIGGACYGCHVPAPVVSSDFELKEDKSSKKK